MTNTNRFLNRFFLALTGVITLLVGVFLVVVALPGAGSARDALRNARDSLDTTLADTPVTGVNGVHGSYLPWALAALCLVLVIVGIIAAATRGRGRTDLLLEADDAAGGIAVSSRFAETAIVDALSPRRDVASVSVSAYRLHGASALKIRMRLAAGSSPQPAIDAASGVVTGLDRVLGPGAKLPVLLELVGASPARPGADSRVK